MECYKEVKVVTHFSELSNLRGDTMLKYTTSQLLQLDNDQLYEVYSVAVKNRELNVINVIRNIVYDRFSLRALEHSPVDNWRNSKDIARFFTVK